MNFLQFIEENKAYLDSLFFVVAECMLVCMPIYTGNIV